MNTIQPANAATEPPQVFFTAVDAWKNKAIDIPRDQTCVAEQGHVLAAQIDWQNYDLELIQIHDDDLAWERVHLMEASSWFSFVKLAPAVSSPAWSTLHDELQPELAAIRALITLDYSDACNRVTAIFSDEATERKVALIKRLAEFDGGEGRAVAVTTMEFLNDRTEYDFEKFEIRIHDVGIIGAEWVGIELRRMSDKVTMLAQAVGVVLTDDVFDFLRQEASMIEAQSFASAHSE